MSEAAELKTDNKYQGIGRVFLLRVEFLLKTDSGHPKDAGHI